MILYIACFGREKLLCFPDSLQMMLLVSLDHHSIIIGLSAAMGV